VSTPYATLQGEGTTMKRVTGPPSNCSLSRRLLPELRLGLGMLALLLAVGTTRGQGTVVAWGVDNGGQLVAPPGLTNVIAVSAGYNHTLALTGDGTAVAWGDNSFGQTNIPTVFPGSTNLPPGSNRLADLVAISAGPWHNMALRSNGTVVAWGYFYGGETAVPAGLNDVVAISAGGHHCLALRSNGTVVAWGRYNTSAHFGVPAGLANVTAIAGGYNHDVALLADGHVVAWGDNLVGQTNVPPGLCDVVAIAAGNNHSLALTRDGTLVTWGSRCCHLTNIPPNLTNILAIAAGGEQSVVLRSDGTVVAWGAYNTQFDVFVPEGLDHVSAVAAAEWDTVALIPNQFMTWQPLQYVPPTGSLSNGFFMRVWSLANQGVVVTASSNLVDWEPIFTNPPGGGLKTFIDTTAEGRPWRFYRALMK
jgi:hypothetical protein